jgi:hypothetical protein
VEFLSEYFGELKLEDNNNNVRLLEISRAHEISGGLVGIKKTLKSSCYCPFTPKLTRIYCISFKTSPIVLHFPQNFPAFTPFTSKLTLLYFISLKTSLLILHFLKSSQLILHIPQNFPACNLLFPQNVSPLILHSLKTFAPIYFISFETSPSILYFPLNFPAYTPFPQKFPAYTQFPSKFPHLYSIFLNTSPLILHFPHFRPY